jgi:Zn-dependent peptidase ImmA (M78 family)
MERGFKAHANRVAMSIREELGLSPYMPLDCEVLAEDLGIPLLVFTDLYETLSKDAWNQLVNEDEGAFSALTVFTPKRTVVLNDMHHRNRQRSSLAHEIAHALLMHPPLPVHSIRLGNHRDSKHEAEANYLAGALLIPEPACLAIARSDTELDKAAFRYGVSKDYVQYRLRISGALVRVQRERGRRRFN